MRKLYFGAFGAVVAVMIAGGVAGSLGSDDRPQPSPNDVKECNEYARWMADRQIDTVTDQAADERLLHGALLNTGTLDGLAEINQENARAAGAYRQCMVRRGYKAWG